MNTLARLRNEAERLQQGKVFVSSESVSAYKVANNKKQLLEGDHPLVLSLPDDDYSSGTNLSLLEASVGPELRWTLSSINHVLRTASKWGEPTYLFANILDTDPQAFVAVTLNKRTSSDALEHLEGVISRVCHFHVAESKPMQVPGPDQVVPALGKGLMKLVFGGSSSNKHKGRSSSPSPSPPPCTTLQQLQQQHPEASSKTAEQERADYLASLEQRRGAHVATAADRPGGYGTHAGVKADEAAREGEYVPTAPVLPVNRTAMDVGSKQEADARLAALKADLRGEGGAPSAPGVYASASDTRSSRPSAYPTIPTDDATAPQQYQGPTPDWQAHTPGTLSNPFTGGSSSSRVAESQYPNRAPDLAASTPSAPHTISYDDYLSRDEQWGATRGTRASHKTPEAAPAGVYDTRDYADAGWGGQGGRDQRGSSRQAEVAMDKREQRRLRYEEEARQAREEWERAQREAAAKRAAAESVPPSKPCVRYHEVHDDGGWGGGSRQPAYAYSGAPGGQQQQQQQDKRQEQQGKQQAPDWLEVLGKVFAGGPAYANYAPDL